MKLYRLDEVKGTIKLLIILNYEYRPITRLELLRELRKVEIGRTAAYKAFIILNELGLIEEYQQIRNGKRVIATGITEKGIEVAEKLNEIEKILENKQRHEES